MSVTTTGNYFPRIYLIGTTCVNMTYRTLQAPYVTSMLARTTLRRIFSSNEFIKQLVGVAIHCKIKIQLARA